MTTETVAAGAGRLYVSHDGAQHFTQLTVPAPCASSVVHAFAGHPTDPDTFALGLADGANGAHVFITHDGGKTMVDVPLPTSFLTAFPPVLGPVDGLAIDRQGRLGAVILDALVRRSSF